MEYPYTPSQKALAGAEKARAEERAEVSLLHNIHRMKGVGTKHGDGEHGLRIQITKNQHRPAEGVWPCAHALEFLRQTTGGRGGSLEDDHNPAQADHSAKKGAKSK